MRLSINSATAQRLPGTNEIKTLEEATVAIGKAGFDCVDLDFIDVTSHNFILAGTDWQKKVEQLKETTLRLGMSFYQCHAPFMKGGTQSSDPRVNTQQKREFYDEMCRRTMVAAGMLGVKWVVMHPMTMPEYNYERIATLSGNHRYFDPLVELGIQNGVGTAFENMLPSLARKCPMRYCQHYDELIEYVDSYADSMVGICWDTGHANQAGLDQARALQKVGSRLKAVHIDDNRYGNLDEHLLPFTGTVDWQSVTQTLAEIDFSGVLNYETQKVTAGADGAIKENLLEMCYANACYVRNMIVKAKAERNGC